MKGKCPEWGKTLIRFAESPGALDEREVRCPSCREHYHQLSELEWSE